MKIIDPEEAGYYKHTAMGVYYDDKVMFALTEEEHRMVVGDALKHVSIEPRRDVALYPCMVTGQATTDHANCEREAPCQGSK